MAGLASLLSRRTMNPRAAGAAAMRRNRPIPRLRSPYDFPNPPRPSGALYDPPPGGKHGGQVKGYSHGGVFPRHGSVSATPGMPG